MSSMICPNCRTVYAGWAQKCSTCAIALVVVGDRIDVLALSEDQQVVYELAEWSFEHRALLGEMLAESEVPHAWEGDDLIVAEIDEPAVDAMCEQIESGEVTSDVDEISYELDGWSDPDIDRLEAALAEAAIDAVLEGDTLVVRGADEAAVDAIIDVIVPPAESGGTGSDDGESGGGASDEVEAPEAPSEILGQLFVIGDKLARNAGDQTAVSELTDVIDLVDVSAAPFGLTDDQWNIVADAADALADALADLASDQTVLDAANRLRSLTRPYV